MRRLFRATKGVISGKPIAGAVDAHRLWQMEMIDVLWEEKVPLGPRWRKTFFCNCIIVTAERKPSMCLSLRILYQGVLASVVAAGVVFASGRIYCLMRCNACHKLGFKTFLL